MHRALPGPAGPALVDPSAPSVVATRSRRVSSDELHELPDVCGRVAAAWLRDPPPSIDEIVRIACEGDEQAVADALTLDAENRRARSMPSTLEAYQAANPSLRELGAACRALLMVEVVARAEEPVSRLRDELNSRFLDQSSHVEQVLSIFGVLHDCTPEALPPEREPGTRLGKYVLECPLGAGAFGEAWQAFDTTLERHVALKILRGSVLDKDKGLEQVLVEARAAAALDHPAIVRVHEAGQFAATGEGFIDSQLIGPIRSKNRQEADATTLEDRLSRGPLGARDAAMLIAQIARGVAMAHARGITHRDIKPANILLGVDGRPLLADFGLSVSRPLQPQDAQATRHRIAGTPAYMAPEVAMGQGATPLSDVYSLGATLRALLSGEPPFAASVAESDQARAEILTMVRTQPLGPLKGAVPTVPASLASICDHATAFAPQGRYESAERLAADLEAFLDHRPVSVHRVGMAGSVWLWHQRNRLASTVGIAAGLALTVGTIGFVMRLKVERDRALVAQVEASRQRDAAVAAREVVETMNQFIARTFNSTRGLKGKADFTIADAISLAADRAGLTFNDRPLVEASVRHFLGQAAVGSGNFALARIQLDRAMAIRRDLLGPTHRDTVATLRQQAELLAVEGKNAAAAVLFEQVARTLNEPPGSESPDMLRAQTAIAGQLNRDGKRAEALELLERVVWGYRRLRYNVGADHQGALNSIVTLSVDGGAYERAIEAQKEIIALNTANLGGDDISTLNAIQALGWVQRKAGQLDLALATYEDVVPRYERLVGKMHVGTIHCSIELVSLLSDRDPPRAMVLANELWAAAGTFAVTSQYFLRAQLALGRALLANQQYQRAFEVLTEAVENCTKARGSDHVYTTDAVELLARAQEALGKAQPTAPEQPNR